MKKNWFPDSLVLIFSLIVLAQVISYVLPAGTYERTELVKDGHTMEVVVPGSYQEIPAEERKSLSLFTFLLAIPRGMADAQDIIFFVFIIGGAVGIMRASGAIDSLIGLAVKRFSGNATLLISGMVALLALGSSVIGLSEEYVPFFPILVTMCLALCLDSVVALAIIYVGAGIGYGCAALNPFTVIIAQNIAGLEPTSGQWLRWILLVIFLIVGIHHVLSYANSVKKDPERSLVRDVDYSKGFDMPENVRFTLRHGFVLFAFVATIITFVYGTKKWGWYLDELSALFAGLGIVTVAIAGMSPNRTVKEFCKGAAEMTTAALLIGFARAIMMVLNEAMIKDTIIYGIASLLQSLPSSWSAIGMYLVQSILNLFIPSGSGQAYVTMPIMAPLADIMQVKRQTAVLAYQFGDGFTNMIIPTNALLMGMLAMGKIPYQRWVRFIGPLLIKIFIIASIVLYLAVRFGYE